MKDGTKDNLLKLLGIALFLASLALGHVHCGTAECGGTETGNPTTCTTQNSPTTGGDDSSEDGASAGDSGSDEMSEDGATSDPSSDNDLSATPSLSDPFLETLAWGNDADPSIAATTLAFDNEGDFAAFWEEFFGDVEAVPEVDFSTRIVAVTVMGEQNTGGYEIAFTGQRIENDMLVLTVTETAPGPDCVVIQNPTNPYHVISVPTTGEDVSVETEFIENDCE